MFKDNNCINKFIFKSLNFSFLYTPVHQEIIARDRLIAKLTGPHRTFQDLYLILSFFS